jgi:cytidylate kinase
VKPRGLVIALDGPSGAGKSTAGRALAARLAYVYVDTGAMYRALALKALRARVPLDSGPGLAALCHASRIELLEGGGSGVRLDGEDVSAAIRAREVSVAASQVSVHPEVRSEMVARQRAMGAVGGIVMDGRDIGSVVFPDADLKFYVDADPRLRAERRQAELRRAGVDMTLDAVEKDVRARDHADTHRSESPLTRAEDALLLDTTGLSQDAVLARLLAEVERRLASEAAAGPSRG